MTSIVLYSIPGEPRYVLVYLSLGALSTSVGLVLAVYWHVRPPPAVGSVWEKEEQILASVDVD